MRRPESDGRSSEQIERDERLAAEPLLSPPSLPPGSVTLPLEAILQRSSGHPVAVTGIVENGLVKPLDPAVRLPEHARVIIVMSQGG